MNLKNIYKGKRYVPLILGAWDVSKTTAYEALTVVTWEGNSYTSKKDVPIGVDITNEEYWIQSGNYNYQIEMYRKETYNNRKDITTLEGDVGSLKTDNTTNKNNITILGLDVDALQTDNTANKNNITNLENDNTTNKNNITVLQDDVEKVNTKISDLRVYLKDYSNLVVNDDWSSAIQKASDDITASLKLKTIVLTSDIKLKAPITLDASYVRLDGNGYDIDCTSISSGNCINITGVENPPYRQNLNFIENVRFIGNMNCTCIKFDSTVSGKGGSHITLTNVNIYNFNVGIDYSNGAYLVKHYNVNISYCMTALQVLSNQSNYGENLSYFGCAIFNNDIVLYNSLNLCDMYFTGCSFDYNAKLFIINRCKVYCNLCHFEASTCTEIQASINGNGGVLNIDNSSILYNGDLHQNYFAYVETLSNLSITNTFMSGLKNIYNTLASGTGIVKIDNIKTFDGDTQNTRIGNLLNMLIDGGFELPSIVDNISITEDSATISDRLIGTNLKLEQVGEEHYSGSQCMRVQKVYGSGSNSKFSVFVPVKYGQKIDTTFMQKSVGMSGTLKVSYNLANVIESANGLHSIRAKDTKQNIDIPVGTTSWSGYGLPNGEILVDKLYYNFLVIDFDFYYVNGLNNFWYLDDLVVSTY